MRITLNVGKHVTMAFIVIMLLAAGYGVVTFYAKVKPAAVATVIVQPGNLPAKAFWQWVLRTGRYDSETDLDLRRVPYGQIVTSVQRRAAANVSFAVIGYIAVGIILALRLTGRSPDGD